MDNPIEPIASEAGTMTATPPSRWGRGEATPKVTRFLQGPQPRRFEFTRAMGIFWELLHGFRSLHFLGPCVTVFGSARFGEGHPYYDLAREVGGRLAEAGFTVMTGGGPGVMEAANRGAKEAGGTSVGCNIALPQEQHPNAYLDRWVTFDDFAVRKLMLIKYSYAFMVLPGGFGTLDEVFGTLTLVQTGKIRDFPMVFVGRRYWEPLLAFVRDRLVAEKAIDPADAERIAATDSPAEAVASVTETAMKRFGLTYGPRMKRRWWLGER